MAIVATPSAPRIVYAAVLDGGGFYKSTDGGKSWRRSVTGGATEILGLALDRRRPGTLYAGGYDPRGRGGVFRSTNAGRTWTDISAGMTTTWTAALALDPAGHRCTPARSPTEQSPAEASSSDAFPSQPSPVTSR
jgi:photosystem II stability/assembly factor-like uncharacterized protein